MNERQSIGRSKPRTRPSVARDKGNEGISATAIAVPIVVMIACAFLWKFIALGIDRELGLIAWAIGGAIGASAVASGARGHASAAACAVLVVMAIFGGKYLYMSSYQQDIADLINDESSIEMQAFMETVNDEAAVFAQTSKDQSSIRQFMYDYDYTAAASPALVSSEELADFREYVQPMLERGAETEIDAAQYLAEAAPELGAAVTESTWSWVFDSLGLIDLLFLFLGCGTAFRMVSEAD